MIRFTSLVFIAVIGLSGCNTPDAAPNSNEADSIIEISLSPGNSDGDQRLAWSPKAAALVLKSVESGLEGDIVLGSEGLTPFHVRLEKSGQYEYFDVLRIDTNRNGSFADDDTLSATPKEVRYAMWSSFETILDVPVRDPESGETIFNPYPLSLWYVESLRENQVEHALRFSRRGWMQGRVFIEGVEAHVRLSESVLDGVFTLEDEWTLALPDSVHNLFAYQNDRPAERHAWLGEKAYQIRGMNPTGRSISIEFINPGVTRGKEALDDDKLAVDRLAPHSGGEIEFARDFATAERDAKAEGKTLFIDFDAVWCGPCKQMDEWVYTADSVVEATTNMIAVKVDGDDYPDIAKRFEVVGYPTMIRMAPNGEITHRLSGYQSVETMTTFLIEETPAQDF
jgi:thiol-disulfide isomerase/thioredoxin